MRQLTLQLLTLVLLVAAPALAKKNNPRIDLEFVPQQSVGGAEVNISGEMLDHPVAIRFEDDRTRLPEVIGSRTDDDDRHFDLTATTDVMEYVERIFSDTARRWGLRLDETAGRTLRVRVLEIEIEETNQAVGATYTAVVRLAYSLLDSAGESLVSVATTGDATRYGKKFSNANCNEVLSDAMLEAFAQMLSDRALQEVWAK